MKLTLVLLTVALCAAAHPVRSQHISLTVKNSTVENLITLVEKQTGLVFIYKKETLDQAKKVSISVQEMPVKEFLETAFKDQPFFCFLENQTVILQKRLLVHEPANTASENPSLDVSGKITDTEGVPLEGASVKVKGTKEGTSTNIRGEFILKAVGENAVLEISSIGYQVETVSLNNRPYLIIPMKRSENKLDETVVMAYGSTTKRFNVSNTGTIKAADIANQPVANPLMALQGHVPGVAISASSGLANAGARVSVLGPSTFTSGNDPLIVIDGIPYTSNLIANFGDVLGSSGTQDREGAAGSPLNFINPQDIERIDVLKDADATAIYGSRAANGAILITTKKGKAGKMSVDVSLRTGISVLTTRAKLLNTKQYLELRREAFSNYGVVPSNDRSNPNYAPDLMVWDTTRNIDLQKELLSKPVTYTNAQVSVSGGNSNVNYLISGMYNQDSSPIESVYGNNKDRKFSTHIALNTISDNRKFRTGVTFSYLYDINQLPQSDFTRDAMYLPPNVPEFFHADGSLNWAPDKSGSYTFYNPYSKRYSLYANNTANLVSRFEMGYELLPGLTLSSSVGINNMQSDDYSFNSSLQLPPEYRSFVPLFAHKGVYNIRNLVLEPLLTYKGKWGKGTVDAIAGFNYQKENRSSLSMIGRNFRNDESLWDITQAASLDLLQDVNEYKYNAGFGKFSYIHLNKYMLNLALRRDASSRFGPGSRYHDFGSVGTGWIISEENWFKKTLPFIDFAKLRISYGSSGNDQINDYAYMDLYSTSDGGLEDRPYQGNPSLRVSRLPNPYLQWEETRKLTSGLDFSMLKNRISGSISYADNRSGNQLVNYYLPSTTGSVAILKNFPGIIQNSQWEFSLNTVNISNGSIKWTTSLNLTIPRNKLLRFDNLSESPYSKVLEIGIPINIVKVFRFAGLNRETGTYQFYDKDGKITNKLRPELDKTGIIKLDREFYGGLQNTISYKSFTLDFFLYAQKQFAKDPGTIGSVNIPGNFGNMTTTVLNRWQKPGDGGIQKLASGYQDIDILANALQSDLIYRNIFYLRLKNINLNYAVPAAFVSRLHLTSARVFVQAQNIKVWTNYTGMDPENPGIIQTMPLRLTLVFGAQLSF
ncbi:MAG: SusC/RagA family TonB-linked outer membrane protein [Chitinophagaceae bacterium]|nr:SusC/RagA family TonB-linked outer membrane protein [Chitinophagaceae bacterium]